MGRKQKPLPKRINGIKILEDLGTIYATEDSCEKRRCCIAECPKCKHPFEPQVRYLQDGRSTQCRSCRSKKPRKTRR